MTCNLLGPLEWRAHRVRPADRIVVVGLPGSNVVHRASTYFRSSGTPLKNVNSLSRPCMLPSALAPLSPTM